MNWLQHLAADLDDDMPCLIVDDTIPSGVWWSDDSMPFVHVTSDKFNTVHDTCVAAFGCCAVLYEGDA